MKNGFFTEPTGGVLSSKYITSRITNSRSGLSSDTCFVLVVRSRLHSFIHLAFTLPPSSMAMNAGVQNLVVI